MRMTENKKLQKPAARLEEQPALDDGLDFELAADEGTEQKHGHTHSHDGVEHCHEAGEHSHSHSHFHSPEEKKKQLNRLSRVIGHLQYVKRMIENDEDCADVLNQISASKSALNGLGKEIINEHISHCIYHAVEDGDISAVEEFQKAIQRFI